jgi:hypothetical protein
LIEFCAKQTLEKEMGERRLTYYAPCGISACPELDVDDIVGGSGDVHQKPLAVIHMQMTFLGQIGKARHHA